MPNEGLRCIREEYEQLEKQILSPNAVLSVNSRGRQREEDRCPIRTDFQRDRDRIIHSKSFRRLKYKTQVFIDPDEDHYRTRLTHTLEVAQIARTIARALRLNEDLTEAIALGHDLGHTPFGHAGEQALDDLMREHGHEEGFHHSRQSLRVVDVLEKYGRGLNLTWEVRDGILNHSKGRTDFALDDKGPSTLEGKLVRVADRVAYVNHDIDDAIRAGILTEDDLPAECADVFGRGHSHRIGAMVTDIIQTSCGGDRIAMSEPFRKAMNVLKEFLFDKVYTLDESRVAELSKAKQLLKELFRYYAERPGSISSPLDASVEGWTRMVCDFIAGMTDRYARQQYTELFMPRT
ncbi:MAG: deoxyguanosinetriphosphate triphosphohydrolase [Armatimonadota bacterium]|nr:deoxyguanosinetriphosphate triphosphohydrolase [Armatimonadota bacterium]